MYLCIISRYSALNEKMEAVCFGAVDRPQSRGKVWSNVLLAFTRYGLVGSTDRLVDCLCFAAWAVGKGN